MAQRLIDHVVILGFVFVCLVVPQLIEKIA